jgi:hypothetical protein
MDIVGNFRIGMTREEVVAVLGTPDAVSTPSRRERVPGIYEYSEIELHFGRGGSGKPWMVYTEVQTEEGERKGNVLLR